MNLRSLSATLVVMLAAAAVFYWGTDGFRAFTAETARRVEVVDKPRAMPHVQLLDQMGRMFTLQDLAGDPVIVEFIFTRCQTVCLSLGALFYQLQNSLPDHGPASRLQLVTISFDLDNDDRAALHEWAGRFDADPQRWRVARPVDEQGLQALLEAFGVIVIPDAVHGFEHNVAVHLLDSHGRLAHIDDIQPPERLISLVDRLQ